MTLLVISLSACVTEPDIEVPAHLAPEEDRSHLSEEERTRMDANEALITKELAVAEMSDSVRSQFFESLEYLEIGTIESITYTYSEEESALYAESVYDVCMVDDQGCSYIFSIGTGSGTSAILKLNKEGLLVGADDALIGDPPAD
jgi:hypothetical protein